VTWPGFGWYSGEHAVHGRSMICPASLSTTGRGGFPFQSWFTSPTLLPPRAIRIPAPARANEHNLDPAHVIIRSTPNTNFYRGGQIAHVWEPALRSIKRPLLKGVPPVRPKPKCIGKADCWNWINTVGPLSRCSCRVMNVSFSNCRQPPLRIRIHSCALAERHCRLHEAGKSAGWLTETPGRFWLSHLYSLLNWRLPHAPHSGGPILRPSGAAWMQSRVRAFARRAFRTKMGPGLNQDRVSVTRPAARTPFECQMPDPHFPRMAPRANVRLLLERPTVLAGGRRSKS